jgi:prepilin-type processing-associated H-X9-DG protein
MLVVIAIIGVLMSMLIPAVTAARDSARRVDCGFKMGQLGKAVIQYDLSREGFPGFLEATTSGYATNWVIMTLPYLGRPDILNAWRDTTKTAFWLSGGTAANSTTYRLGAAVNVPLLKELVCPSDQPPEQCPLSYVANCGMADLSPASNMTTPPDWPANGPFHNHFYNNSTAAGNVPPAVQVRMSAADIKTGATFTLMLSENVQAGEWTDPYSPDTTGYTTSAVTCYLAAQTLTGMVFSSSQLSIGVATVPRHINESIVRDSWSGTSTLVGSRPTPPTVAPPVGSASPAGYTYARPSSFHRGGVNVVYCDGHGQFLAQNVNPTVFAAMMTTDRANCRQPGTTATPTNNSDGLLPVRTYIFSNTDVGKN